MTSIKYTIGATYSDENNQGIINPAPIYDYLANSSDIFVDSRYGFFSAGTTNAAYILQMNNNNYIFHDTAGLLIDVSDLSANSDLSGTDFGDVIRGGSGNDNLKGGDGNDILEGGVGENTIEGGTGINTISYEHYAPSFPTNGVYVNLLYSTAFENGGLSFRDYISSIQNVLGSSSSDVIVGDDQNNTLNGGGGGDYISGLGGNDRIVIAETPTFLDGGDGKDLLFVGGGGNVILDDSNGFQGIEAIYVRNDTALSMIRVGDGAKITSQSTLGHSVVIYGTSGNDMIRGNKGYDTLVGDAGNDRIAAGKGGAWIDGGTSSDKLFGGVGSDTFYFGQDFGRDNVYQFDANQDHFTVLSLVDSFEDVEIKAFHGGRDTLITFGGDVDHAYKIILHDVEAAALTSDNFIFS